MTLVLRTGPVSARLARRPLAVGAVAAAITAALAVVSLGSGEYPIAPDRILATLAGSGEATETLVVTELRLPRLLLGLVVGAMLGLSGALVQTTARNALASPELLGVTGGASVGAVAVIVLGGTGGFASALDGVGTTAAALVGGLLSAAVVAAVLRATSGGALQLVLVGVGVSATVGGLTSWLIVEASIDDAERASAWLMGSLGGRGAEELHLAAITLALVVVALLPLAPALPSLHLGGDTARTLGHRVGPATTGLLLLAVALASVAAATAGPIGFVALVAPHLARLAGAAPRAPLLLSAIVGAALVTASDLVARAAFAPLTLPTGAVTAIVGAPFLVWLLLRQRKGVTP
ncbi:FecCD family ABC transporter permease [Mycetocola reblochoni]|uniref:ABC-type Fe3+-siderophore transport system, permease 2 component n=2 Tax=Mycetocola reblochoni TaxID=331618 RepID=A0A1R4JID4_9MICO|nr:iron ABC transporter permease [Mycetocola reblochoni]RLP70515.1 iron ABC transporter permease [Mycetocola reblochoni]SJN31694.1 ABC-type Fe3+-siderophore transport system, permease 2 component [Mycetocola reblochoni REB411]